MVRIRTTIQRIRHGRMAALGPPPVVLAKGVTRRLCAVSGHKIPEEPRRSAIGVARCPAFNAREHHLRAFVADHDTGGIGVAGDHGRHDRVVGNAQGLPCAGDAPDTVPARKPRRKQLVDFADRWS